MPALSAQQISDRLLCIMRKDDHNLQKPLSDLRHARMHSHIPITSDSEDYPNLEVPCLPVSEEEAEILDAIQASLRENPSLFLNRVTWKEPLSSEKKVKKFSNSGHMHFEGSLRASILVGFLWATFDDSTFCVPIAILMSIIQKCCEKFTKEMALESLPADTLQSILIALNDFPMPIFNPNSYFFSSHKKLILIFLDILKQNPALAGALCNINNKSILPSLKRRWEKDQKINQLIEEIDEKIHHEPKTIDSSHFVLTTSNTPEWCITYEASFYHNSNPPIPFKNIYTAPQAPSSMCVQCIDCLYDRLPLDQKTLQTSVNNEVLPRPDSPTNAAALTPQEAKLSVKPTQDQLNTEPMQPWHSQPAEPQCFSKPAESSNCPIPYPSTTSTVNPKPKN